MASGGRATLVVSYFASERAPAGKDSSVTWRTALAVIVYSVLGFRFWAVMILSPLIGPVVRGMVCSPPSRIISKPVSYTFVLSTRWKVMVVGVVWVVSIFTSGFTRGLESTTMTESVLVEYVVSTGVVVT